MAELIQFDSVSGERIARAVRTVEAARASARPLAFDLPLQQAVGRIRIGSFTGAWSKGDIKTVSLRYSQGTFAAINLFAAIPASGGSRNCAIARDGTAWHLIAAEC